MSYTYFFYFTNIMRCFLKKKQKKVIPITSQDISKKGIFACAGKNT